MTDPIATLEIESGASTRRWPIRVVVHLLTFAAVLAVWVVASNQEWVSERILPPPAEVFESWWNLASKGILADHLGVTLWEVFAGFVLGAASGFIIAVVASFWAAFRAVVWPYMVALQVTPRVAIAPLLFIWLGFGALPKIVLAATICFFPVLINSLTGLMLVDEEADQLFRSLGATRSQRFFRLVGEFVSAQEGLGLLIQRFSFQLNTSAAYAVLLTLTVIGLVLYGLMELADRWIVYWNRDDRLHHRTEHAASKHAAALIRISKNQ